MCSFSVVQPIRCLPPTAGVPSSRLNHSMWASWTKSSLCRFFSGFLTFSPTTNFIPPFFHTHLFRFIRPCDGASGLIRRHPYCSQTFNKEASSHLSTRPYIGHELRICSAHCKISPTGSHNVVNNNNIIIIIVIIIIIIIIIMQYKRNEICIYS